MFCRIAVLLATFTMVTNNVASAWKYEEFYSGMTEAAAVAVLNSKGLKNLVRIEIADRPGAYVLQNRSMDNKIHLEICREAVHGIAIDMVEKLGDLDSFHLFSMKVESERKKRGSPNVRMRQAGLSSLVWATWQDGQDEFEYIFDWRFTDKSGRWGLNLTAPNGCPTK